MTSGELERTDALIVGGGPSGLAAAIALQSKGLKCVVADPLAPAIDKACGEGLMPDAITALDSLGVTITEEDGKPFRGIRFISKSNTVHADFPRGHGYGVRRTRLHERLLQRAEEAGAQLRWNTRIKLLDRHTALIGGSLTSFDWLIGADGASSFVRRWAGFDAASKSRRRFGFRIHYRVTPWSDYVEVYWSDAGQLYVTPVSDSVVCVVFLSNGSSRRSDEVLEYFPEIADRLRSAKLVSKQRGGVSTTRKLQRVADHSIALIGDASGSADAVTGEGLAMSFRQAAALADAIHAGSLQRYVAEHRRIGKLPHRMGAMLLAMSKWPTAANKAIAALQLTQGTFDQLIASHLGEKSLVKVVLSEGPRIGWALVTKC